jgi:predicted nucleotidyltransferase
MIDLYDEFFSIIETFENAGLTYAVIGGFAMTFHDKPRLTEDIDILIDISALNKANELLERLNYFKSTDPHPFLKINLVLHRYVKIIEDDYLVVDILVGKGNRFGNILDNAVNVEWEKGNVSVVNREDLIWLKQNRNSDQDKVDIKNLHRDE